MALAGPELTELDRVGSLQWEILGHVGVDSEPGSTLPDKGRKLCLLHKVQSLAPGMGLTRSRKRATLKGR